MLLELLNLLFGAGLGTASSEAYGWFCKKANENNDDIQIALLTAYYKAVQTIREYCQTLPEWDRDKAQIDARLNQIKNDALEILGITKTQREKSTTAFEVGSLKIEAQQQITITLMNQLQSEDKWLKEAPPSLSNAVKTLLIPVVVHQFRVELKNDPVVFRTLIHDMLTVVGADVSNIEFSTQRLDQKFDKFIGFYGADIDHILQGLNELDERFREIHQVLQQITQRINDQTNAPHLIPLQFQSLIVDKTKEFIGREFIFSAIENFIQGQPKGYFTIVADPGVGKSAIAAEYVQRTKCIAYFNQRAQGITRTEDFLRNVCIQLIERYKLPYSTTLHPNNVNDGNFLIRLLNEVSNQLKPKEKLIIVVDALDEVDLSSQSVGANVLYLPAALPNNVYFILTQRPRKPTDLPLLVNDEYTFDLTSYQSESLQDIKRYILQRVNQSDSLQIWISSRELTNQDFITILAEKSDRNFMYLCYVLPEIEENKYQDLSIEEIPQGLQNYYYQHWERMGMNIKPVPRSKIRIVYILAEAPQPASRQLIAEYSDEDAFTVQQVLDEWRQFLHEQRIDQQTRYSIYHASFQDFLRSQNIVQATGMTIADIKALIADNLFRELEP